MDCQDIEITAGCFKPTDPSVSSVGVSKYTKIKDGGSVFYLAADTDPTVAIDPVTFLGGGTWTSGACVKCKPECVESQEWTYGIDNTGTQFNDVADYVIELSDGSTLNFSQDGSSASWTQQLTEWSNNIQAAADAAGLAWFVEPRAVNNIIPADISGNYGGTPTGLPGAPSVAVADALIKGGMVARYVNFQICPGQPVPVGAYRTTSNLFTNNPYNLLAVGAILGPIQKFFVCQDCGSEPVWYLDDNVTEASVGQIPDCWEPCGTISLIDSPPDRDCNFQISVACDNNNSTNTVDFINTITRRATICNGEQIDVDYFQEDPTDQSALIPYTLVGDFVDCATGEPIALPDVPCDDFVVTDLLSLDIPNPGLRNREWHDTQPAVGVPQSSTQVGRDFYDNHDESLPTTTDTVVSSFQLNDTDNTTSELDIQFIEGYITVEVGFWGRYVGNSEGYQAVYLGECGSELVRLADSGGSGQTTGPFYIPAGTHYVRLVNIDSGGTNSSKNLEVSPDGVNFSLDNSPDGVLMSRTLPVEKCHKVKICKDNDVMFDVLAGDQLNPADLYVCSKLCDPPSNEAKILELLEAVIGDDSDTCPCDQEFCIGKLDAFDFDRGFVSTGDTTTYEILIDGVIQNTIVHDYLASSDGVSVSSYYTPIISALDALGWSFTVDTDVPIAQNGKVTYDVAYTGSAPSELTINKGNQDTYVFAVDASGVVTYDIYDTFNGPTPGGSGDFNSPAFTPC